MIRRDYARQLYLALVERGKDTGSKSFLKIRAVSSVHATWPSLIKAAIEDSSTSKMQAEQWIGSIATALLSTGIEWVPTMVRLISSLVELIFLPHFARGRVDLYDKGKVHLTAANQNVSKRPTE